ncbi:MAG: DUF3383 family protein [Clostridia bacterium]|nr:DUF3383 family protein [Clostridia bacterium]
MSKLKIDDVVNVVVSSAGAATPRDGFNIGLIIGTSSHITVADRCKVYSSLESMIDDGFLTTDPEYLAATKYFSQDPAPQKVVIGVKNSAEGSSETWVQAITACKQKNGQWYGVYVASATALSTADHQAIAAYVETIIAAYFFEDSAAADLTNGTSDVFAVLKAQSFKRTFGLYSTTKYAGAAALGFAMGANDGTAGSAYTMAYKTLAGVSPDDLSETDVENLKAKNANYYVTRGSSYIVLENGVTAAGEWFDDVIGMDQLSNDIQIGCMDVLTTTRTKVPYTDAGAQQFVLACKDACENALTRGFLAPGIWEGNNVLNLETGDTLESGYMCQAEPVADQASSQRSLRICPPIYVCIRKSGAIQFATIKVFVV